MIDIRDGRLATRMRALQSGAGVSLISVLHQDPPTWSFLPAGVMGQHQVMAAWGEYVFRLRAQCIDPLNR